MTRTLNNLTAAVFTVMAVTLAFGLVAASGPAQASGFLKIAKTGNSKGAYTLATASRTARKARVPGTVCCLLPRTGRLALATPLECRRFKGRTVSKSRCDRIRRISASKFRNIVLKRGLVKRSKPSRRGAVTAGGAAKGGIHCMGGKYYPCACDGADACNTFIAACAEAGADINCDQHGEEGKPTGCVCYK